MLKVYTGGTFDLFHWGHVNFLRQCSVFGDVTVSLNTDEFIEAYKGKPPIFNYERREEMLYGCRYVDEVVDNFGNEDSKPVIEMVNPDIIAIGTDWAKKDYYKQMGFTQEWLDAREIVLVYIPYTNGISTTAIKKILND